MKKIFFTAYKNGVRIFALIFLILSMLYCFISFEKKGGLSSFFYEIATEEGENASDFTYFFNFKE